MSSSLEDGDVPSSIDFHDPAQARAWLASTIEKRPWRPNFFAAFCTAIRARGEGPLRILELGSGPGHLAREILTHCAVREYVALDFSPAMHDLAREHLGELAARVTFVERDFREAAWTRELAAFDVVVTMQAAHETRHKRHLIPLLRRTREVLASGGVLLYADHYLDGSDTTLPALFCTRNGQRLALTEAGLSNIAVLHDEGGMALYTAAAP